jgi:hypothetical protein
MNVVATEASQFTLSSLLHARAMTCCKHISWYAKTTRFIPYYHFMGNAKEHQTNYSLIIMLLA